MITKKFYLALLVVLFCLITVLTNFSTRQNKIPEKPYLNYPEELVDLARSIEMEPINGDAFERPEYYGGQGLPYVFGILKKPDQKTGMIPSSVLFWCRKEEKEYLVYAVYNFSNKTENKYEVKEVISEAMLVGHEYDLDDSFGMIAYDGVLGVDKDLSNFIYLSDRNKKGPEEVLPISNNGFIPVIIYNESSVQVLYNYKGKWLTYVESDI